MGILKKMYDFSNAMNIEHCMISCAEATKKVARGLHSEAMKVASEVLHKMRLAYQSCPQSEQVVKATATYFLEHTPAAIVDVLGKVLIQSATAFLLQQCIPQFLGSMNSQVLYLPHSES